MNTPSENKLCGTVGDVKVHLTRYLGRYYADIRVWFKHDSTGEVLPTRRGITIPASRVSDLIRALESANMEFYTIEEGGESAYTEATRD